MGARSVPYRLFNEDCLKVSKLIPARKFGLIYLDPPFGTGVTQHLGANAYDDQITGEEYLTFLMKRVEKLVKHLEPNGFLVVHLDKHYVYEVKNRMASIGIPFAGDVIWAYRRWSSSVQALQNNHDTLLVFTANQSYQAGRILIAHSIVAPSSRERVGYPTQKPIGFLKKLFQHFDNYGAFDSILDPFMGSGSTLVAGLELGKTVCGFDVSTAAFKIATSRLRENAATYQNQLSLSSEL
ncbi:hypothetical protein BH10BDE1_BH10BDE1_03360 [soil metagenome]